MLGALELHLRQQTDVPALITRLWTASLLSLNTDMQHGVRGNSPSHHRYRDTTEPELCKEGVGGKRGTLGI